MNHYFDDIFHRYEKAGSAVSPASMPRLRRSSTARSLGARSDFYTDAGTETTHDGDISQLQFQFGEASEHSLGTNGTNGHGVQNGQNGRHAEHDDDDNDDDGLRMHASRRRASRSGSMFFNDPARVRERAEADEHLHRYIADQLQRFKSSESLATYERGDEFEAQADSE